MPVITLPDGSQRNFDASISVQGVAADIGAGLAKAGARWGRRWSRGRHVLCHKR
jgi:hypothetical protein